MNGISHIDLAQKVVKRKGYGTYHVKADKPLEAEDPRLQQICQVPFSFRQIYPPQCCKKTASPSQPHGIHIQMYDGNTKSLQVSFPHYKKSYGTTKQNLFGHDQQGDDKNQTYQSTLVRKLLNPPVTKPRLHLRQVAFALNKLSMILKNIDHKPVTQFSVF